MIATKSILWDNKRGCMCNVISEIDDVMEKKRNVMQRFTYFLIQKQFWGLNNILNTNNSCISAYESMIKMKLTFNKGEKRGIRILAYIHT